MSTSSVIGESRNINNILIKYPHSIFISLFVLLNSSSITPTTTTTGVRHANIICDGCKKSGLAGIRFRCGQCANYDLCASCYGDDVHDLTHEFIRYQTANSAG